MEEEFISNLNNLEANTLRELCGEKDENLLYIEKRYGIKVGNVGGNITCRGDEDKVAAATKVMNAVICRIKSGEYIKPKDLRLIGDMLDDGVEDDIDGLFSSIIINSRGKQIRPKTAGQAIYVKSMSKNSVVFGVGPAGTGKTYLAVAMAVKAFKNHEIERIVLTRPAVEAGEKLGFLPGDLGAKVDPYLRPLYDALQEMFGLETYMRLIERNAIEIAPLAYMRGRTLSNAFIILDEAQNTTREQMKMFLTRMGDGSRIVVTGDVTQIDLPRPSMSGLLHAMEVLVGVEGLDIIKLSGKDVVRHEMVMRIVNAYEKSERSVAQISSLDK